jgi:hypothetical protein
MNKILPFVFVFAFWGVFYLGTKNPGLGETIAFIAVAFFVLFLLYSLKSYLFKIIKEHK